MSGGAPGSLSGEAPGSLSGEAGSSGAGPGQRGRFAPSTSGPAHPGTLLAALLCWLDARSRDEQVLLRLEDVDPARCTPELAAEMQEALAWFGLDWDGVSLQSEHRAAHDAALARLVERGDVYACRCSRSDVRAAGLPAADGGWRYPGTCRDRPFDADDLGGATLRLRLEPGRIEVRDESGVDLGQDPAAAMGDPVLRRRDGAVAYHLAVVVDDAEQGIGRVVRGRDLAASTAIHRVLQQRLGLPTPVYRHHLLLLEERGGKLAKLHGAVSWRTLRDRLSPEALCGMLAHAVGLCERPDPVRPAQLRDDFSWRRVAERDRVARWTGSALEIRDEPA